MTFTTIDARLFFGTLTLRRTRRMEVDVTPVGKGKSCSKGPFHPLPSDVLVRVYPSHFLPHDLVVTLRAFFGCQARLFLGSSAASSAAPSSRSTTATGGARWPGAQPEEEVGDGDGEGELHRIQAGEC